MGTVIVWFRRDLRLADNPALAAAKASGLPVIPVYIHSPEEQGVWADGGASRWWLHHSLAALEKQLAGLGVSLVLRRGPSLAALETLCRECGAEKVVWNRLYEPSAIARDSAIKESLRSSGIAVDSFNASLLDEPWQGCRANGEPYRVFTPYWKSSLQRGLDRPITITPDSLPAPRNAPVSLPLDALELLPKIPWDGGLREHCAPGESAALKRLSEFVDGSLNHYAQHRDHPEFDGTSLLSPHLHFGELSPAQVVVAVRSAEEHSSAHRSGAEVLLRELGWREFAYHLLYHQPHTPERPLDPRFDAFPWAQDYDEALRAWQQGRTGVPIVDAGMRQLWRTGWMHNRVRMVAASYLVKNLLVPWQQGARWFWDTLVDADLAANTLGWQWVAGSGADAAPYFRIFNPVLQGEKFDPGGHYVHRWVPELRGVAKRYIHRPWEAPVRPAEYPLPLVDLKASRERALAAFRGMGG